MDHCISSHLHLYSLGADNLFVIANFLDCSTLLSWQATSKMLYACAQNDILWKKLLPSYPPLVQKLISGSAKYKVIHFNSIWERLSAEPRCSLDSNWTQIGSCHKLAPRFLARSAYCSTSHWNFLFGGDLGPRRNGACRYSNELWAIRCIEESATVCMHKIEVCKDTLKPFNLSASAVACLYGDLYLFGGIAASSDGFELLFTNEFWRLADCASFRPNEDASNSSDGSLKEAFPNMKWENIGPSRQVTESERAPGAEVYPSSRWGHTLVGTENMLILFGGSSPIQSYDDLWVFVPNASSSAVPRRRSAVDSFGWVRIPVKNPIGGRGGHSAAVVNGYLYILGGNDVSGSFYDLWRVSIESIRSVLTSPTTVSSEAIIAGEVEMECISEDVPGDGGPIACIGHCMSVVGNKLFVYGGREKFTNAFETEISVFDVTTFSWSKFDSGHNLSKRTGHNCLLSPTGIIYIGGILPEGEISADILHLNLFGIQEKVTGASNSPTLASQRAAQSAASSRPGMTLFQRAQSVFSEAFDIIEASWLPEGDPDVAALQMKRNASTLRVVEFDC